MAAGPVGYLLSSLPHVSQAEDGHAVAKKQLEKETLMRVDLENRCQSLQEELAFSKSVFDEEVRKPNRGKSGAWWRWTAASNSNMIS